MYIVSQDGRAIYNLGAAEMISNQNGTIVIEHGQRIRVVARYSDPRVAEECFSDLIDMIAESNSLPFSDNGYVYWFKSEDK